MPNEAERFPVVVIGSGPGGLQLSYSLRRYGVDHVLLSKDEEPGGMFRRFPIFQRLITWSKPYAPAQHGAREYEWYDWNSLIPEGDEHRELMLAQMDGTSYFPARDEMQRGIEAFATATGTGARYGCSWEGTERTEDGFLVHTSTGDIRCEVLVVAVGMTQAWKPPIPGIEDAPHYVDVTGAEPFRGKDVFIIGKRNSGFELADGLLPYARRLILGSPRPARFSWMTHSTAAARARYDQPYEDHILGGGHRVLDVAIERVQRTANGYTVYAGGTSEPGSFTFEVDEVIAATGFTVPLQDLRELGVRTFSQDRLPSQTHHWESATVPGIFFAGSITQGAIGLKKYGMPSSSAAVHGFRYNAMVLARRLAERFGRAPARPALRAEQVVPTLASSAARAPELWNQQGYLAHVISFGEQITDDGIQPLAAFVDEAGPDAAAITVETDGAGDIHPALYVRRAGAVEERILGSHALLDFDTDEHRAEIAAALKGLID